MEAIGYGFFTLIAGFVFGMVTFGYAKGFEDEDIAVDEPVDTASNRIKIHDWRANA
jgi:hypothetical protein